MLNYLRMEIELTSSHQVEFDNKAKLVRISQVRPAVVGENEEMRSSCETVEMSFEDFDKILQIYAQTYKP